jgi:hypothetical protein
VTISQTLRRVPGALRASITDLPPIQACLAAALIGGLLIFLSYLVGIHSVQIELASQEDAAKRQVGYIYAPNWSVNYAAVFPFMLLLMLESVQLIPRTLATLSRRGMFLNENWRPVASSRIDKLWRERIDKASRLPMLIILTMAIFLSFEEWYRTNFRPLIISENEISEAARDWGVGAVLVGESSLQARLANLTFDFLCFTLQAVFIFYVMTYFCTMAYLSIFIRDDLSKDKIQLVPDIHSHDSRRGFEIFEPVLNSMLLAGLFAYIMAYFSRLQNIYLHCPHERSLWEFIREDIIRGISSEKIFAPFAIDPTCQNALPIEPINIIVIVCTLISMISVLIIIVWTLRNAAEGAKGRLEERLAKRGIPKHLNDVGMEAIQNRLNHMDFWPFRYIGLNLLLAFLAFGAISLVFYRVGLFVLGVALVAVAVTLVMRIVVVSRPPFHWLIFLAALMFIVLFVYLVLKDNVPLQNFVAMTGACVILGLVIYLVSMKDHFKEENKVVFVRALVSLMTAVFAAAIPGFIDVKWVSESWELRAGGALAIFIITYFFAPNVGRFGPSSRDERGK